MLTAAREGNVASVLALLEFGCDPSTPNNEGWTPLAFAARGAPKKERQPESWLQLAEALLRAKADMAATTSKGFQPLHYACASNHAAAVRVLLQRGANPSAATAKGITALHVACFLGLPECVEVRVRVRLILTLTPITNPNPNPNQVRRAAVHLPARARAAARRGRAHAAPLRGGPRHAPASVCHRARTLVD